MLVSYSSDDDFDEVFKNWNTTKYDPFSDYSQEEFEEDAKTVFGVIIVIVLGIICCIICSVGIICYFVAKNHK